MDIVLPKTMRNVQVDWNNVQSLSNVIKSLTMRKKELLKKHVNYKPIGFNGSVVNIDNLLPAFEEIFLHRDTIDASEERKFYVYAHCNPMKLLNVKDNIKHLFIASHCSSLRYEPFYIGKGTGNRYRELNRNGAHRKMRQRIEKNGKEVISEILFNNLTESEAFNIENNLIDIMGLTCFSKHGILTNLDEGVDSSVRRKSYTNPIVKKVLKLNGFI